MVRDHHRDEGQNVIEVVGLVIVTGAVLVALVGSGALGSLVPGLNRAVCRVFGGGCRGGSPPPRVEPVPEQPVHACVLKQQDVGAEGTVEVGLRYFTVRGGGRFALMTRTIRDAQGHTKYEVQLLDGGDLGVGIPSDDESPVKAYGGLSGEKGTTYRFDTQARAAEFARQLPQRLAREKAYDAGKWSGGVGLLGDWVDRKFNDGRVRRLVTGLPDPQTQYYEGGSAGGIEYATDKVPGLSKVLSDDGLGLKGKAGRLAGVRHDLGPDRDDPADDVNTAYLKYTHEGEGSLSFDLSAVAKLARATGSQGAIEQAIEAKVGKRLNVPAPIIDYLKRSGGNVDFGVKAKPDIQYELDFDGEGRPKTLREVTDTTYVFTVKPNARLNAKDSDELRKLNERLKFVDRNDRLEKLGVEAEVALVGGRTVTTKELPLDEPGNAEVAARFIGALGRKSAPLPIIPPRSGELERRFQTNGDVFQQHFDLDSYALNLNAKKGIGGKGRVVDVTGGGHYEKQRPDDAEYWDPARNRWAPDRVCGG